MFRQFAIWCLRKLENQIPPVTTQGVVASPPVKEIEAIYNTEESEDKEDLYNFYKPKERLIYTYWNGEKDVEVDPLVLYKKVMDRGPEISIDIKVARSASKDASISHTKLIEKIRSIFGIKKYEEGGLTESECINLLDHFLIFVGIVKKNSKTYPISPTETSSSSNSSSEGSQPTTNSLDSGSTEGESSTEPLTSFQSEPESPPEN